MDIPRLPLPEIENIRKEVASLSIEKAEQVISYHAMQSILYFGGNIFARDSFLRELLDLSPRPIFFVDLDGTVVKGTSKLAFPLSADFLKIIEGLGFIVFLTNNFIQNVVRHYDESGDVILRYEVVNLIEMLSQQGLLDSRRVLLTLEAFSVGEEKRMTSVMFNTDGDNHIKDVQLPEKTLPTLIAHSTESMKDRQIRLSEMITSLNLEEADINQYQKDISKGDLGKHVAIAFPNQINQFGELNLFDDDASNFNGFGTRNPLVTENLIIKEGKNYPEIVIDLFTRFDRLSDLVELCKTMVDSELAQSILGLLSES